MISSVKNIFKILGPGLLYAGAAIGVSHLIQSTRAGGEYGFSLMWAVIIANVLKYPFFSFGPRYAVATGESLIEGYQKLGKWIVGLFLLVTFLTMFTIQGAVTIVTAGIASNVFHHLGWSPLVWSCIILGICLIVLGIGKYSTLDNLMKVIIVILSVSTILAVLMAFGQYDVNVLNNGKIFDWTVSIDKRFLIALMGWMPAPLDIAVWHSLWTLAKAKNSESKISMYQSRLDFNIGYWGTALLAMAFLSLGALVLYGNGDVLALSGVDFAKQLMNAYTKSLGNWAYPIIAAAALTTMFSTTLTCLDAFPRVLVKITEVFRITSTSSKKLYWIFISFVVTGTIILLFFFISSMKAMVEVATILSFLTAPVLAIITYKLIRSKYMPQEFKLSRLMNSWSILGIVFLIGFSLFYLFSIV